MGRRPHRERSQRFQAWVRDLLTLVEPGLVVYDRPTSSRVTRRDDRWFIAQEALLLAEVEGRTSHVAVRHRDVVRHVVGLGNGTPDDWIRAAEARWNRTPTQPKEAEALGLLTWALDAIGEELIP